MRNWVKETETETMVVYREPDGFSRTYYKTREAAFEAAKEKCRNWGSNLVSRGSSPVTINGETLFENMFNVWD
jgi:hypothetical protein